MVKIYKKKNNMNNKIEGVYKKFGGNLFWREFNLTIISKAQSRGQKSLFFIHTYHIYELLVDSVPSFQLQTR